MRYAKIHNKQVVRIFDGDNFPELEGGDYALPIRVTTVLEEGYPEDFYTIPTAPNFRVEKEEVNEEYNGKLKSVEDIKLTIYTSQKAERQAMQLGSFDFGGTPVPLKDREDSIIISTLPEVATSFKVGEAAWVDLDAASVALFKEAHRLHVQAAYDWERLENEKVAALSTVEELATYVGGL